MGSTPSLASTSEFALLHEAVSYNTVNEVAVDERPDQADSSTESVQSR